jgi:hypothetical protein
MVAATGAVAAKRCDFDQGSGLAHMRQAKAAADQAAAGKDFLHLFRRSTRSHVEILWDFSEQQIADAAADQECLEPGVLQVPNDIDGMRAEFS